MSSVSNSKKTDTPRKSPLVKKASTKPSLLQATLSLKTSSGYGSLTRFSELTSTPGLSLECSIPATPSRELSLVVEHLVRTSSAMAPTGKINPNILTWEKSSRESSLLDLVIYLLLATKHQRRNGSFKALSPMLVAIQEVFKSFKTL